MFLLRISLNWHQLLAATLT
uniref:Uncharacterized protein n=1 Tax=Arundo donax TaxID=35708 RepID=A0A0A8ZRG2_ARUDO